VRRGIGPKAKGASFERLICSRLSLWVSGYTREDLFWRSAMSGGRATLHSRRKLYGKKSDERKQAHNQEGDITAIDPLGSILTKHFVIECKFYAADKLNIVALVFHGNRRTPVVDFWTKLLLQCGDGQSPMLIIKQNRQPELICLDRDGIEFFAPGVRENDQGKRRPPPCNAVFPRLGMHVYPLRQFLRRIDFDEVRRHHEG
jgi:hypothetical protein